MQSHYEINVSYQGRHFFATAERSCVTEERARQVYEELVARFPAAEGFEVSVSFADCGYRILTERFARRPRSRKAASR